MNRLALAAFAALLVGCPEDTGKTDSGMTDMTDPTDGCDTTYSGPTVIQEAGVTCANDTVTIDVMTDGWTADGRFYMIDSANEDVYDNNSPGTWAEEHDILSVNYDPCGAWDELQQELTAWDGVAPAPDPLWLENEATLFQCGAHFNADKMTYAAAVYDVSGGLADCLVWGDDTQGVINNSVLAASSPFDTGPTFDESICVVGQTAR